MKKLHFLAIVSMALSAWACSEPQSAKQQVDRKIGQVYNLTAEERAMALANAKKFFEQPRPDAENQSGYVAECKPSDSNKNGLVSCYGMIPKQYVINDDGTKVARGFEEQRRYCGYVANKVGCQRDDE